MSTVRTAALIALSTLFFSGAVLGPAVASPQPSPVCPVCGDSSGGTWGSTDWRAPDHRTLTVKTHRNGSATWDAELRWDASGGAPGPSDETRVQGAAEVALDESLPLPEHDALAVDVPERGVATIRWRTAGVVDERVGHGVFRPFHGEGTELLLFVNVDRLIVHAPPDQVVTNGPAVGTVTDDGTAVAVDGPERNVGDFYVVFGDERDAASTVTTQVAIGSILWPIAGENFFWLLVFPTIAFAVGLAGLYAAGRRWNVDPERSDRYAAYGIAAGLLVVLLSIVGPLPFGSLFSLPAVLLALVALAAFGYAVAIGGRRLVVGTAVAVPGVALAPFVANAWPAVQFPGLYLLTSVAYTGLAVGIVVLGVPCFYYGMTVAERRAVT